MKRLAVRWMLRLTGIALVIICTMQFLNIVFAIRGNPVSLNKAEREILRYADAHYGLDSLYRSSCYYRFKDDVYVVDFRARQGKDIDFSIIYNQEKEVVDASDYQNRVEDRANTIQRLEAELTRDIKQQVVGKVSQRAWDQIKELHVRFLDPPKVLKERLPLDAQVTDIKDLPLVLSCTLDLSDDSAFEQALSMRILHRILVDGDLRFHHYNIVVQNYLNPYIYEDLMPSDITKDDLVDTLETLRKNVRQNITR